MSSRATWARTLLAGAALLFCTPALSESSPTDAAVDDEAISCLASVLKTFPDAVAVTTADDMVRVAHNYNIPDLRIVAKGVNYTFLRPDGGQRTIGIYLWPDIILVCPHFDDPKVVCMLPGSAMNSVQDKSGHAKLDLRQPYPANWYPPPLDVKVSPNQSKLQRQNSKDHPLYELWDRLDKQCGIDNGNYDGYPYI